MLVKENTSRESSFLEVHPQSAPTVNGAGKIKSVFCKNFVTYDECSFHPTEYLNVIIGPNGTGKSTLVAAIVLGLGGEPKLLSRASAIQDYIKNGKTHSEISVEICANDDGKFVLFHRSFDESGKSTFKVNDDVVSKNNFLKTVAFYKIQISNLCQFLPQDRVQDFAKMNPQEIFLNTISSVCSQNVVDNFTKLKEMRKAQLDKKKNLQNDCQRLHESTVRKEELKQSLESYNTRKQYVEKLNVCNAKKKWLETKELQNKIEEITNDLKKAEKYWEHRKNEYSKLKNNQENIEKNITELKAICKTKIDLANKTNDKKNKIIKSIEVEQQKIREANIELEKSKREWTDRQNDLRNENKILEVIVQDLKNANVDISSDSNKSSVLQEQVDKCKIEIRNYIVKRTDINKRLDEDLIPKVQSLKNRIDRSKNLKEQKLQLIQNKFPDLHKAVIWLEENKRLFKGHIYKPIILELNVPDHKNAQYFENTIPLRDLLSFVCENQSDVSTLVNELRIKQKLSINVAHSPSATECRYKPNESITNLEKYGFTAYLIDLIKGPAAVLNHLCSLFKLHLIPIGTEEVDKHTDSIPTHIRQYFGGDQRYNVSVSKYSKEPSLMKSQISGKTLLLSYDNHEVQQLQISLNNLLKIQDSLRNERTTIEAKISEIEFESNEVQNKKRAFDSKISRFKNLTEQLKRQKNKIAQLKQQVISVSEIENRFKILTEQHLRNILELQKEHMQIIQSHQMAIAEMNMVEAKVQIYKMQNEEFINTTNEALEELKTSKNVVDTIKKKKESSEKEYQLKKIQAKKLTNNCKPTDTNFPYKVMFEELTNDLENLTDIINDFSARLDCMGSEDQEVVSEYERRCAEINSLEKSIEDALLTEKKITEEINSIYINWFHEINNVVHTLNKHFGEFMKSMRYVGEVCLVHKEEFDFDTYGIQIMVQYRKEVPLQALDRHVQSGGERAVAIAVYTLSLQHITHVPFRCVDEINQGMDARNERKIFEMLVHETTQSGRSQYFFVTPKLLPNLNYNERMSVHIVFNGKMIQSRNSFSFTL